MSKVRAVVFDADGVIVVPQMLFSKTYAAQHGLDPKSFTPFFKGEDFEQALQGRADLKDLIKNHNDIWQYSGDVQDLLDEWHASEHQLDEQVLQEIRQIKQRGIPVYLATNQEKYRAHYMREVMFPDVFDKIFASSDVGYTKKDKRFWEAIHSDIAQDVPGIKPEEIVFFDDSQDSIDGAQKFGIVAHLYEDSSQIKPATIEA